MSGDKIGKNVAGVSIILGRFHLSFYAIQKHRIVFEDSSQSALNELIVGILITG